MKSRNPGRYYSHLLRRDLYIGAVIANNCLDWYKSHTGTIIESTSMITGNTVNYNKNSVSRSYMKLVIRITYDWRNNNYAPSYDGKPYYKKNH